jgi:cell division protein FtsW (lipid II flippase)
VRSERLRELFGLVPAAVLVSIGFASVVAARGSEIERATLAYGAVFLALCLAVHLVIRRTLPLADPYLFPLVAALAAVGLVELYRIDPDLARRQAQWFVVGLAVFAATVAWVRDPHRLERYRYTIAATSILLLALPRLPVIGAQVNGAYLAVDIGPIQFQPAELAKVGIVIFLASYLRDTAAVLVRARSPVGLRRRLPEAAVGAALALTLAGLTGATAATATLTALLAASTVAVLRDRPSPKHFGPLLLVWGLAMVMLVVIRDLGSSLMFFGGFLALLWAATGRGSLTALGASLFAAGAAFLAGRIEHVHQRVEIWLDPFRPDLVEGPGYQIAQSLFAQADGGLLGRGLGGAMLQGLDGGTLLPAPHTDLIYAVVVNELGLAGALGLLVIYLVVVARGLRIALLSHDAYSKLLAAGLTAVFALQVFVIVGGVTRVIPLTGVTLPFVSYGGSSIVANMIVLALLLMVSQHSRAERLRRGGLVEGVA